MTKDTQRFVSLFTSRHYPPGGGPTEQEVERWCACNISVMNDRKGKRFRRDVRNQIVEHYRNRMKIS